MTPFSPGLRLTLTSLLVGAAVAAAPPAFAADGVAEISQTCALAGCFPGDTAGYPVTIDGSAGRSFVLTSDLIVPLFLLKK